MNNAWPILIIVAISIISSIVGKIKEQAEIKRAKDAAQRRYQEQIRTGQAPNPQQSQVRAPGVLQAPQQSPASAGDQLRDIAARRQAELRELRKRQAAQREQRRMPKDPAPLPTQPTERRAAVVRPGTPRQSTRPQPIPQRTNDAEADLRQRQAARNREIEQARAAEFEAQQKQRIALQLRAQKKSVAKKPAVRNFPQPATKQTRANTGLGSLKGMLTSGTGESRRKTLQQLMALNEILDKPVSERRNHLAG